MPSIEVSKSDLESLIKRKLDIENLNDILFDMKCELDRVEHDKDTMIIEVEHDRPDLLSTEGIARSMKGYFGIEKGLKKYDFKESGIKVEVDESVLKIRPFIRCAIARDVPFTDKSVKQIMQLQEKLHMSYAQRRSKASVGIYDLDKTKPDFIYKALKPEKIKFIPLEENKIMDANEILRKTPKGSEYADLLLNLPSYPLLVDSENTVLSMPPILNSEDTKLDEKTSNIFIDVTGLDERTVEEVLTTVTTLLAERGAEVQTVDIIYPDKKLTTPELKYEEILVNPEMVRREVGFDFDIRDMEELLKKSRFGCDTEGGNLRVTIPCYRFDIMHSVDIIEEIAMAYGYNNFEPILPNIATIGSIHKIERESNKVRDLMMGLGFQEVATFILSNKKIFEKAKIEEKVIELANPVSEEYNCLRNSLIPKLLEFLVANKHYELPQKIFEVDDVVEITNRGETKTKTKRMLSGAIISANAGFTEGKSVIEAVLRNLGVSPSFEATKDKTFLKGRVARIISRGKEIGVIGEIHPEVLTNFGLENPAVAFEIELEKIV